MEFLALHKAPELGWEPGAAVGALSILVVTHGALLGQMLLVTPHPGL